MLRHEDRITPERCLTAIVFRIGGRKTCMHQALCMRQYLRHAMLMYVRPIMCGKLELSAKRGACQRGNDAVRITQGLHSVTRAFA